MRTLRDDHFFCDDISVNTETTDHTDQSGGWVLYDGACPFCISLAERVGPMLARRGFELAPLQTPWVRARLNLEPDEPLTEMKLLTPGGAILGGVDALLYIASRYWWARAIVPILRLPGIAYLLRRLYASIAARRYCFGRACPTTDRTRGGARGWAGTAWAPLVLLVVLAVWLRTSVPAWAFMWIIAFALFLEFKGLTWMQACHDQPRPPLHRTLGYLFGSPGMDPGPFLEVDRSTPRPTKGEYGVATLRMVAGGALLWTGVRLFSDFDPVMAGWVGFAAIVLMLHFGLLHLMALLWQRCGIRVLPIMNAPWRSASPAEFWGQRWNLAFRDLAHRYVFAPLRRPLGAPVAMLGAFIASGLVHELVISLPAEGGYGGPTAYFTLQGVAVVASHTRAAKRRGLTRGRRGRVLTLCVVIGPLPLVFHPAFMQRVVIPFLDVVGAV